VNLKAKGDRAEVRAKKELEAEGFLVERAHGIPVWVGPGRCISKHHDFFGVFDLWAIRRDCVRLVQITTSDKNLKAKRDKIDDLEEYLPRMTNCTYEVWWYMGRDGWRVWKRYGGPAKWQEGP